MLLCTQYYMLTKRKRRFMFWATITAFFILSIFVLFYSLGYDFGPKWQLQKTGGIFIQANETGALVTVDGKTQKTTSLLSQNALIQNLNQGYHQVTVSKDSFKQWNKNLEVLPEMVSARDVVLLPNNPIVSVVATTTSELHQEYYLQKNIIFRYDAKKPKQVFVGVEKFWQLPKTNALLILGEDKNLYINNRRVDQSTESSEPLLGLDVNVIPTLLSLIDTKSNLIFDDGENRVIYWDAHTIGSYWIGKEDKMPQWQKTRSILVLTIPSLIRNVMTFPRHGDYLLMEMGNGIWMLEMDAVGGQNLIPVYQGKEPKLIGKNSNTVFILDNKEYFSVALP